MAYVTTNPQNIGAMKYSLQRNRDSLKLFSPFGEDVPQDGVVTVEGPHHKPTWTVQVLVKDGNVVEVLS